MPRPETPSPSPNTRRGRRPTLSLQQVVEAAVTLLDERGEAVLTFRTLAARLDTGVGSIYHYVASKEELLDRATDAVLGEVLATAKLPDKPFDALRALAVNLYLALQQHPWAGAYLMRDTGMQPNSMRLFDLFGRQVLPLNLTPRQQFDGVSSLVSFVVGTGAEMREPPRAMLEQGLSQEDSLHQYAESWRALDAEEFPFVHAIVDEFEHHDDLAQFEAGVNLILVGIAAQLP